jgi:hypothetical protein
MEEADALSALWCSSSSSGLRFTDTDSKEQDVEDATLEQAEDRKDREDSYVWRWVSVVGFLTPLSIFWVSEKRERGEVSTMKILDESRTTDNKSTYEVALLVAGFSSPSRSRKGGFRASWSRERVLILQVEM